MDKGDVVGWGAARAPWAHPEATTLSREIGRALTGMGITEAFGVLGGGIAPFAAGLDAAALRFLSTRHEAGAGFAAIEAFHETGRPGLVVLTTGPGLSNAQNAVLAARIDGAKMLVVSGMTSPAQRGRGAVQETTTARLGADWYQAGPLFHLAAVPESVEEVVHFLTRLQVGFAGTGGFVAHLALPLHLQTMVLPRPMSLPRMTVAMSTPTTATLDAVLAHLRDRDAMVWLGHGANAAVQPLRAFIAAAGLPTITSPRAKGILLPEDPFHVGMSGAGGGKAARAFCTLRPPRHTLVVGSRLSEVTSFFAPVFAPGGSFIHVDVDPGAFGAAYPEVETHGIVCEAKTFVDALIARADDIGFLDDRRDLHPGIRIDVSTARKAETFAAPSMVNNDDGSPSAVDPRALMTALQEVVVDGSDALVMSEAGTSFTWCNAMLRFAEPGRYRTSAAWGSMGHMTAGCVGAAVVSQRAVVAVVGDGAMLMNNEINTAVQYGARVVWVILNDAQLGLNEHGMRALGMRPVETQLPRVDFVAFARSQGADGIAVGSVDDLRNALARALAATGPFVVDVAIDRTVPSPVVADRIASLNQQGGGGAR